MRHNVIALGMVAIVLAGCRDKPILRTKAESAGATGSSGASQPASAESLARFLPDRAGAFSGGALTLGDGFLRRRYSREGTQIEVTIGGAEVADVSYERWIEMSAGFPPAKLGVPPESASGFYDCSGPGEGQTCNLHIHLRTGQHVEVMGGGTATRDDLDQLLDGLPLAALVAERD
jgi:hypothetical protein